VDSLSEERLLAAAVRSLRAQGDARSALLALDEYGTRFPQGRLHMEAEVLRVDALLLQGRRQEALATADHLDVGRMPGGIDRQLQRGELRFSVGRWQEAEADFDGVLARSTGPTREQAERALWGRAQSRARLGNQAGAGADAQEYLRRFPKGRYAAPMERLAPQGEAVPPG
jgi:outer membrane protein assembly factor BamD (BamD/ComL family)